MLLDRLRMFFVSIVTLAAIVGAVDVFGATPKPFWEVINSKDSVVSVSTSDSELQVFDVWVTDGHIYITTEETIEVKVFSILGQLITSKTISPGIVKLTISVPGVYIVKAGSATRRVTL